MPKEDIPDKKILEDFRSNPPEGFRLLVEKYSERLYYHIRRIVILHEDADDALQNSFLKAWVSLPDFRGESSLFTWLYRISTNEALTLFNKRKKENIQAAGSLDSIFSHSSEGETYFDGDAAERKLQDAILQLPEKQRIVFNMKYYQEMKYEDISEILGTSVGALKASYHHAVKKIEDFLSDN